MQHRNCEESSRQVLETKPLLLDKIIKMYITTSTVKKDTVKQESLDYLQSYSFTWKKRYNYPDR